MTARLLGPTSGGLGRWINFTKGLIVVSGNEGELKVGKRSGLVQMTLREFIFRWKDELAEYYGPEFWTRKDDILYDTSIGDTFIFCLVDNDETVDHMPGEVRKKIRKAVSTKLSNAKAKAKKAKTPGTHQEVPTF